MPYVDGFLVPVPKDKVEAYRQMAELGRTVWTEHGATGYVEALADDVPYGELTSFPRAVQATEDETVAFSWILFDSREARDKVNGEVMADPRMDSPPADMPFDGKRMIYGGFKSFVERGGAPGPYVDGFLLAVPKDKLEEYRAAAELASTVWMEHGALSYLEALADDVPYGEVTSFPRAVQAKDDEIVVFAFATYESREARDAVMAKVMADAWTPVPDSKPMRRSFVKTHDGKSWRMTLALAPEKQPSRYQLVLAIRQTAPSTVPDRKPVKG